MTLIQQPKQGKTANFKNKNPLLSHYKYILQEYFFTENSPNILFWGKQDP